jgi:hypothetical protein
MSSIFGGSQQQSSSSNQAYPMLSNALGGQVSNGGAASNQISSMLGLNGTQGQNQAFQNWQDSTGYQFGLNQGSQAITGNAAATGLLNSGATAKALNTYGQNYANTQYGNYNNQLQGLVSGGNQAAGTIAQAGQQSNSSGSSSPGIFGTGGVSKGIGSLLGK